MINRKVAVANKWIFNIYEILLCLYIVVTPIINSIKDYTFAGYGLHIWIIIMMLLFSCVVILNPKRKMKNKYQCFFVLIIFLFELIITSFSGTIGVVLPILSYIAFLCIPREVSLKKIYSSIYISAILAAVFTIAFGYTGSAVERTATLVDGSVAVIVIVVFLWAQEDFEKKFVYTMLKYLGFFSGILVAAFGMSRARISIIAVMFVVKIFTTNKSFVGRGRIKTRTPFLIILSIILVWVVSRMSITQEIIDAVFERFATGFESMGRDDELRYAKGLFQKNILLGAGWGDLSFKDYLNYIVFYYNHNMYMAVLARGGIIAGVAFFSSFLSLAKTAIKEKRTFPIIALAVFFALGYGNAGIFNYTICGMLIPIVAVIERNIRQ